MNIDKFLSNSDAIGIGKDFADNTEDNEDKMDDPVMVLLHKMDACLTNIESKLTTSNNKFDALGNKINKG